MGAEATGVEDAQRGGISRRNALRAGVAVGVGAAAWSGMSITSLGGTPAYAVGCTGAVRFTFTECTNTDSSSSAQWRYHELKTPTNPSFVINNPIGSSGTDCNAVSPMPSFSFPNGYKCQVFALFFNSGKNECNKFPQFPVTHGHAFPAAPTTTSPIPLPLNCFEADIEGNNWFYTIFADCTTAGSPDSCFPPIGA